MLVKLSTGKDEGSTRIDSNESRRIVHWSTRNLHSNNDKHFAKIVCVVGLDTGLSGLSLERESGISVGIQIVRLLFES